MNRINLLFVGDATDGPVEELVPIDSLDSAWRLFGGYQYEYTTISSGQTSYTLGATPWGREVTPLQIDSDGSLIPLRLFEFSINGSTLTWTSLGYSIAAVFRYPAVPGGTSLLKGILAARKVPLSVHAIRLSGEQATAHAGNFTFYSRYAGNRYNGITIALTSGGTVTVTPSGGVGRNKIYHVGSDVGLYELIRNETQKGFQGFYIKGAFSRTSLTVPAGTYTLTGGTNGTLTPDLFDQFLNNWDLAGVDVICPVGLLTTQLSGAGTITTLALNDYPTLVVAQAPPSGVALSGTIINSKNLVSVAFQLTYDLGLPKERLDDGAPVVAAIIGSNVFGLTMASLPEFPAVPKYDQVGLHTLAASGHTTAFRSISKDWALWHVVTGDPEWPVSQYRALQEIARVAFDSLEPTIGNIVVDKTQLDDLLGTGFQQVTGSQIVDWTLQLQGNILYLDISFIPFGEIKVVRAQIAVGQPQAVSPA
jgi:hypothetical protein